MRFLLVTALTMVVLHLGVTENLNPSFLGTYTMTKSVLFDEYMEAVGVGWWLRLMASSATPTTEIMKVGDNWTISTWTTFKTTIINFKLGEEFDELTADGRQCKSTITLELDNKLDHIQSCGTLSTKIYRVFDGNTTMTMTLPFPNGDTRVCIRTYAKQ